LRIFSIDSTAHHRALHSFPTRRSSDLGGSASVGEALRAGFITPGLAAEAQVMTACGVADAVGKMHGPGPGQRGAAETGTGPAGRSEEHTSELQSLRHLVCRLLLEKKKK